MSPVPDLVKLSKLETEFHFDPQYTQHTEYVAGSRRDRRKTRMIHRWKRQQCLGRGAFGSVWLEECIDGEQKGEVRAVKEISKHESGNYNRELEAIALFSHSRYEQCFVKSFGWFEGDKDVFLAMEYHPHGDLHQYLGSSIPEIECSKIIVQIVEGLQFMHNHNFAHRDLKPKNILVVNRGPDWWVKIADFGISKRAAEGQTSLRTQAGTPAFTAPEILSFLHADSQADQSYTGAVDIWSLSVMTFLMLTGEFPFKDLYVLKRYMTNEYPFPEEVLRAKLVGDEACSFLRQTLKTKPEDRLTIEQCQRHAWFSPVWEEAAVTAATTAAAAAATADGTTSRSSPQIMDPLETQASANWTTKDSNLIPLSDPRIKGKGKGSDKKVIESLQSTDKTKEQMNGTDVTRNQSANTAVEDATIRDENTETYGVEFSPLVKWYLKVRIQRRSGGLRRHCIAYSPNGQQIACGLDFGNVHVWDPLSGRLITDFQPQEIADRPIEFLAYSPDGGVIYSVSRYGTITTWFPGSQRMSVMISQPNNEPRRLTSAALSRDGKQIVLAIRRVYGQEDSLAITVWNTTTFKKIKDFQDHPMHVTTIAFSPDGKQLASGSTDDKVRIWDIQTGKTLRTLYQHENIHTLAFAPNQPQLASASSAGHIKIWDLSTETEVTTLEGVHGNTNYNCTCKISYSPDGKRIIFGASDGTVGIWAITGEKAEPLQILWARGDAMPTRDVAFAPNRTEVASLADNAEVRIWQPIGHFGSLPKAEEYSWSKVVNISLEENKSDTESEPAQEKSAEEPARQKRAEEPAQQKTVQKPAQRKKAEKPTQRKRADEPAQRKGAEEPAVRRFSARIFKFW